MKIFQSNIRKSKNIISLQKKIGDTGVGKYLPSFSKEWKNTIYAYNKNELKNIPVNNLNINKIIKSYFNLFFEDPETKNSKIKNNNYNNEFITIKKRRKFLTRIFVSNAETKHTNSKTIITLYIINREKKSLTKKYININEIISQKVINRYFYLYNNNLLKFYNLVKKNKYFFIRDKISKKNYIFYKLAYLKKFLELKNLYSKKIWSAILNKYSIIHLDILRKYFYKYSLNQLKFNRLILLPKLSNILKKILGKKLEYNIINLKSISYHTDLFTNALALQLKKIRSNYISSVLSILNRANIPRFNILTTTPTKIKAKFLNKYKDGKLIYHLHQTDDSLDKVLTTRFHSNQGNKNIHSTIYNSIRYKNMAGIKLEINGRLTKRYRADRSINFVKWKGGLKNIDSSFQRMTSVLFRGNTNSNTSYSLSTSKRRIGAFAVKGWIGGK